MRRIGSLKDISDGMLYDWKDTVEVGCDGCQGKPACCRGMGSSIILDPFDVYRITSNIDITFEQLLAHMVELNVVDGIILPNLKMAGENETCAFLDKEGRCSIHTHRPGICRIFPLGRYYEEGDFSYILQIHECPCKETSPVKAGKWVDTPNLAKNRQFLINWHYFLNDVEVLIKKTKDDTTVKNINLYLLNQFFGKKYEEEQEFYSEFHDRLHEARRVLMPEY
jgi:Fe-S-cluster containining protein